MNDLNCKEQYIQAVQENFIVSKTDPQGIITYVNNNFCKLSGYTQDELLGKTHSILSESSTSKKVYEQLWNSIPSQKTWQGKLKWLNKIGEVIYTDTKIIPIIENNQTVEYLCIRTNITNLNKKIEKVKTAEKVKSTFLANMSHEIRTPLNGIIGFLDLLKTSKLSMEQKTFVSVMEDSSNTLLSIINDILDLSKIEANQLELEMIPIDLKQDLSYHLQMFSLKAQEKGIVFQTILDPTLPDCVLCDLFRLKQIITNLINNAIKFTQKGEVKFFVNHLSNENSTSTIEFIIEDDGIGIEKEKLQMIFEPFSQTEVSVTREYGGTGLGLSITKELVGLLGGTINVTSTIQKGSTFSFSLNLQQCDKKIDPTVTVNETSDLTYSKKTLIVEDNKTNQLLIAYLLSEKSIPYFIVSNGLEAIEEYEKNYSDYQLILMDINMPIMNGLDATAAITQFEKEHNLKHIPIIALTANALKGDRDKFLALGMDGYLTKPIEKKSLHQELIKYSSGKITTIQSTSTVSPTVSSETLYDKDTICDAMEIPKDFLDDLLNLFFESSMEDFKQLKEAFDQNNLLLVKDKAHAIKGAADNLHLVKIAQVAKKIEFFDQSTDDLGELIKTLLEQISKYKEVCI